MKYLKNSYFFTFLLGLLLVLAFSPFNIWILGLLIPGVLFLLVHKHSPRSAFWLGFCFGLGEFGFGTSWIIVSLLHYGNGIFMAGLVTLLFTLILALFPALQLWVLQKICRLHSKTRHSGIQQAFKMLLIYPLLWVVFDLIRGWIFTGFPWLFIGYTQTFTALAGFAKLGSVFLVSFFTVFISGLLISGCSGMLCGNIRRIMLNALVIILLFVVGNQLKHHHYTHPLGAPLQVALIQGNISENEKWVKGSVPKILDTYASLTGPILNTPLIIWPENAVTDVPQNLVNFIGALDDNALLFKSAIVFGIPLYDPYNQEYYNGAMVVGEGKGVYLKQHLIPFGEYLPYPEIFEPLFSSFNIPMSFFSKGPTPQPPLTIRGLSVRMFICYESAYPFLFRQAKDSAYIITLSDDAWFGDSLGPYQHEEMEVMRAIETGRPILRVTNTGITSIIDANGKVLARAPMFQQYVLKGEIQPVTGETPWLRI